MLRSPLSFPCLMLVALAALATFLVRGVRAVPTDMRGVEPEVGLVTEVEQQLAEEAGNLTTIPWKGYSHVPLVSKLEIRAGLGSGRPGVLHVSKWYDADKRDSQSLFVCTTTKTDIPVYFLNIPEPTATGGIIMKIVESKSWSTRTATDGWWLGAQGSSRSDRKFSGYNRMSASSSKDTAIVWKIDTMNGKTVLKVGRNSKASNTVGWYLSVPPGGNRDQYSHWLAIGPDANKAAEVKLIGL